MSAQARDWMIRAHLIGRGITDRRVLEAMRALPREAFVPVALAGEAYGDQPLPIAEHQTISQPYIVAFMTQELDVEPGARVLEVGTGSGYQAAVLAKMGAEVFSIEVKPVLAAGAAAAFAATGLTVRQRVGDGRAGWPEHAPFDRIVVTAAAPSVPPALLAQLAPGGILVAPVGDADPQQLVAWRRRADGSFDEDVLLDVRFLPLVDARPEA